LVIVRLQVNGRATGNADFSIQDCRSLTYRYPGVLLARNLYSLRTGRGLFGRNYRDGDRRCGGVLLKATSLWGYTNWSEAHRHDKFHRSIPSNRAFAATYDVSAEMATFGTQIRRESPSRSARRSSRFQTESFQGCNGGRGNGPTPQVETERAARRTESRNSTSPTCRLTGAIILRLPCLHRGLRCHRLAGTRISESNKRRKADCPSTAAMAGETA